ncbi:MAG: pantetheine-phosphate adenylyltransferase [Gammaproteobacteria bacterium]|nr:pantetheine-phosphate adenylyltransferase [Gammaproteobacteria bacterium]
MKTAIYPGSFDPFTNGHNDILNRSLKIFDKVTIAVVKNSSKNYFFSLEERVAMINELFVGHENIECIGLDSKLTVDLADELGAKAIIRGLRAVSDFEYEFQIASINRSQNSVVESVFFTPDEKLSFISSSMVKELASYKGNISKFVHPNIEKSLKSKLES